MSISNILRWGGVSELLWINYRKIQAFKRMKGSGYRRIVHQYPLTKEQKKEIDDFFIRNYGRKIPYDQHRYYAAHSGVFNAQFFPRYIYHAYFERFMNLERSYNRVFQDKNVLPYLAKVAGVSMPRTIVSLSKGLYRDGNYNVIKYRDVVELLREGGKLFCKPSRGSFGGRSCFSEDFRNENIDIDSVLKSLGSEFVIQETVRCDPSIRAVYPNAVNTFRITTYRWKDDFFYIPAAMRIGHGVHLDDKKDGPRAKRENICFEFCPTSNLQTKSLKSYKDVPLKEFREAGIDVTINSDNMTVSNTDVFNEFKHLQRVFHLNDIEIYRYLNNSIKHSFTDDKTKAKLKEWFDEKFEYFYKQIVEP